ncbi:MAG: polyribonucleotide nucleotidyltransferase [Syntrophobacterales bacterium]|nr:MAG: polyribonucleotide nucleotidyltransferase [Syntrophobacterales bacterium]
MERKMSIELGGRTLSIEAGKIAKQANGAVAIQYGETIVLATAVCSAEERKNIDFIPLTVNYLEMTFAAGRIPGGFIKREGRPSDRETLISRLIDRPIRPLFPKGFKWETQIIATVLSADQENDPAILGMIGASAALTVSDIPFKGPIGGVRVGRINGEYKCNPTNSELEVSNIDLLVSGNRDGVIMVEGGAKVANEDDILEAIFFGYDYLHGVIEIQERLRDELNVGKMEFVPKENEELREQIQSLALPQIREAYAISGRLERRQRLEETLEAVMEKFGGEDEESRAEAREILSETERKFTREMILNEERRIDGRGLSEIRPISCEVGILPRTHGSALFTRGETQVLAVTTFGTSSDEQKIDTLSGESYKSFMLHYNFPPFCVGEVSPLRAPSRREIGHGALAERAILPVLPPSDTFPYTIRVVSEILESNGSSSMATVCGGMLSLMDAGVPTNDTVAGIAMGLVKEEEKVAILSDILGDEDHIGDMDFKVAGTQEGITALQMDIKGPGVTRGLLQEVLYKAKEGRLHILKKMRETIPEPRKDLSRHAPRIVTIQVKPDKIRDIIGPGGKNIRSIIEQTGVKIEIEDPGLVKIASANNEAIEEAIAIIKRLIQEVEAGGLYLGHVKRVLDFGAIVELFPGTDGLIHISQLAEERVKSVSDILKEGDEVLVKVIGIESNGRIRLSRKAALKQGDEKGLIKNKNLR